MNKKIIWLIVSCLMVAALVLASCAPAVVEEKEATVVTKEPEKKAEEVEEVVEEEGPKYGGTLNTFKEAGPDTWDYFARVSYAGYFINNALDQLMMGDWYRDPEKYPLSSKYDFVNPEVWTGCLAESWDWPDPLTITFNLRKGVRWQNKAPANGREFVASDVKWHFEQLLAHPKWAQTRFQNIESVTCPDKYTVVFKFKEPDVASLERVGVRGVSLTCPDVVETYGDDGPKDWENMVGTGPWIVVDSIPDSVVVYERNPDYWMKDPEGRSLPYIDGFKILVLPDKATQMAALRTGKVDITPFELPVAWAQKVSLEASNPNIQWAPSPDGGIYSMWLRTDIEPFSDIRVRKALSMVTNRQEMTEKLLGGSGIAVRYPAHPGWACFTPLDELPEDIREAYVWSPDNIDKAKQLLADAGYPNGFTTSVQYCMKGSKYEPLDMELVKAYWATIGVDLQLRPVDKATESSLREPPFPFDEILAVGGAQATPLDLIRSKWWSQGDNNRSRINDPFIEEMYYKACQEFDFEKRTAILKELYVYIAGLYSDVTLPGIDNWMAWQPWIKGYRGETSVLDQRTSSVFTYIWIDRD